MADQSETSNFKLMVHLYYYLDRVTYIGHANVIPAEQQ